MGFKRLSQAYLKISLMALFTRLVKVGITDSSESKAEKKSDTLGEKKNVR